MSLPAGRQVTSKLMPTTKSSPKIKKCYNCGKIIKGNAYTKIGKMYCCTDCCGKGNKKNNTCEFC
jgi:hypothetical protein